MKSANWTRDELLAVFALYCRMPFGKFDQRNSVIIDWAGRIGRTPSAVAMRLSNFASFDPTLRERGIKGLKNAGNAARELWQEFESDPERVAFECQRVAESLMTGPSESDPLDDTDRFEIEPVEILITDAERTVRVRLVQGFFRSAVLSSYGEKCTICRLHLKELLTASHIVPWSVESAAGPILETALPFAPSTTGHSTGA